MKRLLILILTISSLTSHGQNFEDSLWGTKKFRMGFTVQLSGAHWKQKNMNLLLEQNNRPTIGELSTVVGLGNIFQWNKFRSTLLVILGANKNSSGGDNLEYRLGGGELNFEYSIYRKENFSISPMIGGGAMDGVLKIRQQTPTQPISNVFTNRNTTELFDRQGYINAALNFGFAYAPRAKAHIIQAAVGYRFGFLNTNWSTDPETQLLQNSTSDPLRQVYIGIKMNFMYADRRK